VSDFHVVPSFTLTGLKGGDIAAGFYLVGRKGSGDISRPQTVYLRVRGSKAVLIQDLPGQEW
jgi:hypothetical protein